MDNALMIAYTNRAVKQRNTLPQSKYPKGDSRNIFCLPSDDMSANLTYVAATKHRDKLNIYMLEKHVRKTMQKP